MTKLMLDILRQPEELSRTLAYAFCEGEEAIEEAARILTDGSHIYITGIGSSWHAGMAVLSILESNGYPASLMDASELLHFGQIPEGCVLLMLSRSGRSIEIANLVVKARKTGARIVAVTNTADSPLTRGADVVLNPNVCFDHIVSVNMYSAITLIGGLLASKVAKDSFLDLRKTLSESLAGLASSIPEWREAISATGWFHTDRPTYFLARGGSLASCHAAKLLWEEVAKAPATAMTTGGFRHGSQEIVFEGIRIGLWINERTRCQDLSVAEDIRKLGGKVMLVGQNLPNDAAYLAFSLPSIVAGWQFLIDVVPAQLAAEHLSHLRGVDCDSFRVCSYIVENEYGLVHEPVGKAE